MSIDIGVSPDPLDVPSDITDQRMVLNLDVRKYIPAAPRPPLQTFFPVGSIIKDKKDNELGVVVELGGEYDSNGEPIPYDKVLIRVIPLDNLSDQERTDILDYLDKLKTDSIADNARVNW